ncbi:MAG: RnfABCDGE type electron transport complex subunit C [Clostridia bacterium]|nr:RnfABCDGE type electron transport complex subunit C [Clostridia bacterium]
MAQSFRGGIRPEGRKLTAGVKIETMEAPEVVRLSLSVPVGEAALPCVREGDLVLRGQCVARGGEGLSLPVHSPVSGRVVSIGPLSDAPHAALCMTIENDRRNELSPEIIPWQTLISQAQPEELTAFMKEKGIAGLGGAAFPTWAKADAARGKARILLINCAESEPYLTSVHCLLLEKADEVVGGVKILLRATGATHAIFAVQNDKEDAVEKLMEQIADSPSFSVNTVRAKYPQGDERLLATAVLGREVPHGKTLADIGAVCFNAETCWSVYRAFVKGLSQMERLVTVSGDAVASPAVLLVPFGTSFEAMFDRCGGFSTKPERFVSGGPLMGHAVLSPDQPLAREHTAALALTQGTVFDENGVCVRCGKCVRVCPMHLMPLHFFRLMKADKAAQMERYAVSDCTECGACAYICPARLPLTEAAHRGKAAVKAARLARERKEG